MIVTASLRQADPSTLQQNPFVAEDTSFGDEIVLLSFELALLMSTAISKRHLLPLSGLNLTEVPLILQDLPNLATWYESFGGLEEAADIFDTLDLRRNHLTSMYTCCVKQRLAKEANMRPMQPCQCGCLMRYQSCDVSSLPIIQ